MKELSMILPFSGSQTKLPAIKLTRSTHVERPKASRVKMDNIALSKVRFANENKTENEPMKKPALGSIGEYMEFRIPKISQSTISMKKLKTQPRQQINQIGEDEAKNILMDQQKKIQQKSKACKAIVDNMFKRVYGKDLPKLQLEQKNQTDHTHPQNLINLGLLEDVMSEMQHNPRSHSVMLRKEELQKLKVEYIKARRGEKKLTVKVCIDQERKIELLYRIKNQYVSLKNMIIPSRSEEYQNYVNFYAQEESRKVKDHLNTTQGSSGNSSKITNSTHFFKNTFLITEFDKDIKDHFPNIHNQKTNLPISGKQNINIRKQSNRCDTIIQPFQKFRAYKNSSLMVKQCPSKFQQSQQKLIMQNIMQMKPPVFMYMINHCRVQLLKIIRFRFIKICDDLLCFFLDSLRQMSSQVNTIDVLELSSITIDNPIKFSQKIGMLLSEIPIKVVKLESLDLGTRQFSKICVGLSKNVKMEELSFRHNRIDILGVRYMETLCRQIPNLKIIDVRNNDIPHYANLKDKNPFILFF